MDCYNKSMTHQHNLKVLVFIGNNSQQVIDYLTEKGFPKVSLEDMPSQVEHLSQAGQHRIVTNQVTDFTLYQILKDQFPGEVHLIAVAEQKQTHEDEFMSHAEYFVENNPTAIDELLDELEFAL